MIGRRRDVYNELARGFHLSNIWWRGRSYAAVDPSGIPNISSGRKRVSKDERKAMLESFVNSYKGLNAGKFPTVHAARKQVGGSYYIIRLLLQELEHKSRSSTLNEANEFSMVNEHSRQRDPVAGSQIAVDEDTQKDSQAAAISNVEIEVANAGHMEEKSQTSTWTEQTLSKDSTEPPIIVKGQADDISLPIVEKPVHAAKEEAVSEEFAKEAVSELAKEEAVSENHSGEISRELQHHDEEPPKASSLWGSLKSLADGIFNMWKKH